MTSEDDSSLSEDEIDEIVERVADRLQSAGVGGGGDAGESGAESADESSGGEDAAESDDGGDEEDDVPGERIDVQTGADPRDRARRAEDRATREKRRAKREAERRRKEAKRRARGKPEPPDPPSSPGPGGEDWDEADWEEYEEDWEEYGREWEAFGRRMEDFGDQMERFGERLGRSIERKLEGIDWEDVDRRAERAAVSGLAGLNVTPDEHTRTAIYKSQLQKGGRIAVPDAEIEALGIEPGDTLQVVLFPVGREADDEPAEE